MLELHATLRGVGGRRHKRQHVSVTEQMILRDNRLHHTTAASFPYDLAALIWTTKHNLKNI